jgi:hypothetical protein
MRIGDILYFSPRFKFSQLNFEDEAKLLTAFQDRVYGFYLAPASRSLKARDAFAGGLLCCVAIELIAGFISGEEPAVWIQTRIAEFAADEHLAARFWVQFRHGLTHEGRVKSSGQFSQDLPSMLSATESVLIVNPDRLLQAVETAFEVECHQMTVERRTVFVKRLRRYFGPEIEAASQTTDLP